MRVRLRGLFFVIIASALVGALAPGVRAGREPVTRAPEPPGVRARPATAESAAAPAASAATTHVRPRWKRRIDRVVEGRKVGVAVHLDGTVLYQRRAKRKRVPASNEKLLTAMVLLEKFDRTDTISTIAAAPPAVGGIVSGDLWILGRGDPVLTGGGSYPKSLPFRATNLNRLATALVDAGVTRVTGSIKGSTGFFRRDWWAPGWRDYFPKYYIPLPTALTFNGNRANGRHISDPERRAARALTRKLRKAGVKVDGAPAMGSPPGGLVELARIESPPFETLIRHMNRSSSNFFAEVLGKRAGAAHAGAPGTIAKGAAAIQSYGGSRNVSITPYDASGLSYANRISARGLTRLLDDAHAQRWGAVLRRTLPKGGQGTLEKRLHGVRARAKTGTLVGRSALSGYVWLERRSAWASFSVISAGMSKSQAAAMEDKIVRILEKRAR